MSCAPAVVTCRPAFLLAAFLVWQGWRERGPRNHAGSKRRPFSVISAPNCLELSPETRLSVHTGLPDQGHPQGDDHEPHHRPTTRPTAAAEHPATAPALRRGLRRT